MIEIYFIGLTLMGGCVTFYLSMREERYKMIGEYSERIHNWHAWKENGEAKVTFKAYYYSARVVTMALLITFMWPISIIPCAGALIGNRMRTRA